MTLFVFLLFQLCSILVVCARGCRYLCLIVVCCRHVLLHLVSAWYFEIGRLTSSLRCAVVCPGFIFAPLLSWFMSLHSTSKTLPITRLLIVVPSCVRRPLACFSFSCFIFVCVRVLGCLANGRINTTSRAARTRSWKVEVCVCVCVRV